MRVIVNVRGHDARGDFNLQQRVVAESLLDALDQTLQDFQIKRDDLTRVHLQPDDGRDDKAAAAA